MKKKYYIILIALLAVINGVYFIISNSNGEQEKPKIISQLKAKGSIGDKREFEFIITNVGKDKAKFKFPTWLEYNISINNLDGKELNDNEVVIEHKDLDDKGRILVLNPNESVHYRIYIHHIPEGHYEISINSATGYGGTQIQTFTVD